MQATGPKSERCAEISRAFVAGGLKCPVEERLRDLIWLKLIGNAAFNPVSVLTRATLGGLGQVLHCLAHGNSLRLSSVT